MATPLAARQKNRKFDQAVFRISSPHTEEQLRHGELLVQFADEVTDIGAFGEAVPQKGGNAASFGQLYEIAVPLNRKEAELPLWGICGKG